MSPAPYPNLVTKNQFGEQQNQTIIDGSFQLWCNWIVDSANGNGLGLRTVKGLPNAKVYMHTSASPAAGSPNPAAGYISLELTKAFSGYRYGGFGVGAPVTGTPINVTAGLTQHIPYVITSLGTTTAVQWQTLGLPTNLVPTVGQSFYAITASAGGGTGQVQAVAANGSGIDHVELIGDPNQMCDPTTGGAYVNLVCYKNGTVTQPVDGTVIGLTFVFTPVAGPLI